MRVLSAAAVSLGAMAAFAPQIIGMVPRLGPEVLYRLRLWRAIFAVGALAVAVTSYARRPTRGQGSGLLVTAFLAGLSQLLDLTRVFVVLDRPPHRSADVVGLPDEAEVLGVEFNDMACAWPVDLVARHHLVNDRVAEMPVLVSY